MTSAFARGLATITHDGTVLDVWYPSPTVDDSAPGGTTPGTSGTSGTSGTERLTDSPQQFISLVGPDEERGVARISVATSIASLDEPPVDAYDAYLRLHLLSHRLVRPHGQNLDGLLDLLANVVWTNYGPCAVADFQMVRGRLAGRGPVTVFAVDKVPRMADYVVPTGVRIADADRVRLGAYLTEGTTVMHEGFVNYNAGTLGASLIEGRISAGVTVGQGTDVGGGASLMGSLSGVAADSISVGEGCLLGANSGLGISLGDNCVVEAGLYVTAGTKLRVFGAPAAALDVPDGASVKAARVSGVANTLFRRNSVTGSVEATPRVR